jgi:uncharacterized protein YaaR (DUF327 family)
MIRVMDKISDGSLPLFNPAAFDNLKTKTKKSGGSRGAPVRSTQRSGFKEVLSAASREIEAPSYPASEEALALLLDDVYSAGDELKSRPYPEEIAYYKKAVKNFLKFVVENGYAVEERTGIPKYLKPGFTGLRGSPESKTANKYVLVQVVDQKLEELALGLLKNQTGQIELLARIEEIAGLLINLLQ